MLNGGDREILGSWQDGVRGQTTPKEKAKKSNQDRLKSKRLNH